MAGPYVELDKRTYSCHHAIACGDRTDPGPAWKATSRGADGVECFCAGFDESHVPTGRCYRGVCMHGFDPEARNADETSRQWEHPLSSESQMDLTGPPANQPTSAPTPETLGTQAHP